MITQFNINSPTAITCDSLENIDISKMIPEFVNNILIVTGKTTRSQSITQMLSSLSLLYRVNIYRVESGDPTYQMVDEGARISKENQADMIIAIGGGTKIDLAKAIAVCHYLNISIQKLMLDTSNNKIEKVLTILAIPTTAGTGSELSKGAVLTDEKTNDKSSLRTPLIIPKIVILDPNLTLTLPRKTTAVTGFDVFTHAFETYFSKARSPFTKHLSEYVLQICHNTLPKLLEDLTNISLREKMSMSSLLMGYNLANASTCLPHRIQYALAKYTSIDHAEGLSIVYPAWIDQINNKYPKELKNIIEIFSMGHSDDVNYLLEWIEIVGIRTSLTDQGIERKQFKEIASQVTGNLNLDPIYSGDETLDAILLESF